MAFLLAMLPAFVFAQNAASNGAAPLGASPPKFALVIGNGAYTGLSRLTNPVNDANDIAAVLEELGFTVDKILNGSLDQMESAVMRLKNRLSVSGDAYGFFFYAGHGVQSGGENYLIPVDANIPGENFLRSRAVSVQTVLDELNDAKNSLNVVVLDACRDNPFGWARSGNRGLALVSRQPADSIIVYATSAGQTASDGTGRNGLFTGQLLPNLRTPGLEVAEVFKRTGADVSEASNRRQIPAVYNQFFGTAYLGAPGEEAARQPARPERIPAQQPTTRKEADSSRLNSLGFSVGTTHAAPAFTATIEGTYAPWKNSFFELGMDVGLGNWYGGAEHFSLYPYARYALFAPFAKAAGWYAGAGAGLMMSTYTFPNEGKISGNTFAADISTGFIFSSGVTVSYSLRTDFASANSKLAVGYSYRFK